jgi:hypothetical protein
LKRSTTGGSRRLPSLTVVTRVPPSGSWTGERDAMNAQGLEAIAGAIERLDQIVQDQHQDLGPRLGGAYLPLDHRHPARP